MYSLTFIEPLSIAQDAHVMDIGYRRDVTLPPPVAYEKQATCDMEFTDTQVVIVQ